jgi:hypothetical protein
VITLDVGQSEHVAPREQRDGVRRRWKVDVVTRKTDRQARVTLPGDFASCEVTIERQGKELRIRKARKAPPKRYSFKELMAQVTPENIHAEIKTGPAVGGEAL